MNFTIMPIVPIVPIVRRLVRKPALLLFFITFFPLNFYGAARAGENLRLTLDQCLQRALTHNAELKVADESLVGALEKRSEVSKIGYPMIEYEYDVAPAPKDVSRAVPSFFSGELTVFNKFKLGIGAPLTTFGKVKTGQQLADMGADAEREKKEQKKAEITLQVKQLYYGILLAREIHHLLKSAIESMDKEIGKREQQGGTDPSQLLKLKLFRAELDKRMEEGDKRQMLAFEALRLQMGLEADAQIDIAQDQLTPVSFKIANFDTYKNEALENRRDLKLLEIGYEAKIKQVELEKRLMTPNLAVGGFFEAGHAEGVRGLTTTDDFSNPFNFTRAGIGLQLKGQLDYHTSLSKIRQQQSEVRKIEIQKGLADRGVELELKEAYLEVQNTRLDVERAENSGKLARQLLFLTQSNYDIGVGESKDLIDALSAFLQNRGQYFESVFNYNTAVAKLDQKSGRVPQFQN